MSKKNMENISDITKRLNDIEKIGLKEILEKVKISTRFSKAHRNGSDYCDMSVNIKILEMNTACSLFVRDALENSKFFVVEGIGYDGTVVEATYDNRLSEKYIDNDELQKNAEKHVTYLLNKVFEKELSMLQDYVHEYEFRSSKELFGRTKNSGDKSSFFVKIFDRISAISEDFGLKTK